MIKAVGYMRTSSATNVGVDKDSDKRQRASIEAYAKHAGYEIDDADWFYDPALKGEDSLASRPGFAAMMERLLSNGVRTVIVEDASRFARDLIVQLTGHDQLRSLGITLIAANAPQRDAFARQCRCRHEGTRFDAVRYDRVLGAVEGADAFDHDAAGARSLDFCTHRIEKIGQIEHFGLGCGGFNDGDAIGQRRGHHHVVRS